MIQAPNPVFYIKMLDTSFRQVAIFDSWESGTYTKERNGVGSFTFTIQATDTRVSLFSLDNIVQIFRKVPGFIDEWRCDFVGLFRTPSWDVAGDGKYLFKATGVCLNDFLARTIINYPEGTIKSEKANKSESVMKEYVEENCGASATIANERISDGVLPNFTVETDGSGGLDWEGTKSGQNLLDVLVEIAKFSTMDFSVTLDDDISPTGFVFRTYTNQLGRDMSVDTLDPISGKNDDGNVPTIFSLYNMTFKSGSYTHQRSQESNVVTILGPGEGSTRTIVSRSSSAKSDSIYNRRETSRSGSGYISDLETLGDSVLKELQAKKSVTITPLISPSCLYGLQYKLGDKVTAKIPDQVSEKITSVTVNMTNPEQVSITLSED